ncbi:AraC family transcriptional regulator [Flagellimonas sp. S174]|uniref:AraC family transcriptional regulator n=1 Tax=Flagellimonas sp. S174 TaxID=3410790 RepID=UPI003BF4983E
MKAEYQKLSQGTLESSFNEFWVKTDYFGFHWHYHPEVEICYVKQGRGKRIIGDSIADFSDGDLVLVGSNVPHSWITDESFNESDKQIEVYVVQFAMELFEPLDLIAEFDLVKKLLTFSTAGIQFKDVSKTELLETLLSIGHEKGLGKYLKLLQLLNLMTLHDQKELLCSTNYKPDLKKYHEERIMKVCNYIHENYKNQITTEELSNLISMNPSAFCRFFKRLLGKTVVEYTNELRIGHVRNQLRENNIPIYKLAFDSGFSSVAYFNRVFKHITGRTPKQYRDSTRGYRKVS